MVGGSQGPDGHKPLRLNNLQILSYLAEYWLRRRYQFLFLISFLLVSVGCELVLPLATKGLIDATANKPPRPHDATVAWLWFGAAFLGAVTLRNLALRNWTPLQTRTMRDILSEGFRRLQTFSAAWHADTLAGASARQLSRAMRAADDVGDAFVLGGVPALLVLIGLSIQLLVRWPVLGLFSLALAAIYITSNVMYAEKRVRPTQLLVADLDTEMNGSIAEALAGNPVVKAFAAEGREEERVSRLAEAWRTALNKTWNRITDGWLLHDLLLGLLQIGLSGLVLLFWMRGQATPGDFGFVVATFLVMKNYLRAVGDHARATMSALSDMEAVARHARTLPQVRDRSDAAPLSVTSGHVRFEAVTFAYKPDLQPIFQNFKLDIAPGERLGIVGATGSGKSTLIKLLHRLYDVGEGRILIDDQDIAGITQASLRRAVGVVPQDPALFHRTIAENIGYGRPDATRDEIIWAAEQARADGFVRALPQGYDTVVGERGVRLSGGERQRIAIARAFLADTKILALDEATSSLDTETEASVQTAIEELMGGRTTIVIAHRLSTIRNVDRIVVLHNGVLVEQGKHSELLEKDGHYARLQRAGMPHAVARQVSARAV
jgi:ATP-binding cassette subfamily B protein